MFEYEDVLKRNKRILKLTDVDIEKILDNLCKLSNHQKIYFKEHGIPHFHALYNEFNGVYNVETLEMIEGDLPTKAKQLVVEWAKKYQKELKEMWETQKFIKLPGLE